MIPDPTKIPPLEDEVDGLPEEEQPLSETSGVAETEPATIRAGDSSMALGIVIGVALGAVIGVIRDDLALWIAIGIAIGVAGGYLMSQARRPRS